MLKRTIPLMLALLIAIPAGSQAQDPGTAPLIGQAPCRPNPRFAQRHKQRRGDIEARVRTMKIWKLTEELNLNEEQAAKFFPLLNAMEDQQDGIRANIHKTMVELDSLVWQSEVNAADINSRIDQLEKYQAEELALRQQFLDDAKKVLEPAQLGKLVLFNHRFPQVVREMIRDMEERPPGPPDPPRGGDRW